MFVYRRGKNPGDSSKAVHEDHYHHGAKPRPGEVKAYPVGRLASNRNKRKHRMPKSFVGKAPHPQDISDEEKKSKTSIASGHGCMISLMFMGLSTGVVGTFIYGITQYLS